MKIAYLIPLFPLLSFCVLIFQGKRIGSKSGHLAALGCILSAIVSTMVIIPVLQGATFHHAFEWVRSGSTVFRFGLLIDPLTAMMLFVVTYVGSMIFIYSIGYMQDDPRYSRFFAYMSLFLASMLGLVLSNHYVQLLICWELVGVCSYLLIGFWFEKLENAKAGRKAFITTKIGDVGLVTGILLLFVPYLVGCSYRDSIWLR